MDNTQIEQFLKSQLRDGRYVPATKLSPLGRAKQLEHLKNGGGAGKFKGNADPLQGRDVNAVFNQHAVGPGIKDAVNAKTRPSKVHPNVEYGESVSPHLEHALDSSLDPKVLRQAKHKVVYHRGATVDEAVAGATGAHTTTGGKAHVILNHKMVGESGRLHPGIPFHFGEVVNHETAHATKHGKNPRNYFNYKGEMQGKRSLGEEARADATGVHGPGLYSRNGVIVHERDMQTAARGAKDMGLSDKDIKTALGNHQHYWDTHRKVQNTRVGPLAPKPAPHLPTPHVPTRGFPKLPPIGAAHMRSGLAITAAAVAGGMAARHLWDEHKHRRDHGKFATTGAQMDTVEKNLKQLKGKTSSAINSLHITPQQARTAGALGQVGGSAGALTGAAIGAGVGAFAHHAATGAGIGAAVGGAVGGGGGAALGLYSARPKKKAVVKSFTHPSEKAKTNAAQAGLAGASVADVVGAKSAWNETKNAVKPITEGLSTGKKVRALASFAGKKTAFPVVAAGVGATALAEHELHNQQKRQVAMSKSADEVFAKARGQYAEGKHKRASDGRFASVMGASLLGSGTAVAHLSDGAAHIGREVELNGRRVANEAEGVTAGGHTAQHAAKEHREYFKPEPNGDRLAQTLHNSGAHQLERGKRLKALGEDAVKGGAGLNRAGHLGTKVGIGAAAAGLGLSAYGTYRQLKSRDVKKNDEISSDVAKIFTEAREINKALEPETRKGMKVGALTGAGTGGALGAISGAHLAHTFGGAKALGAASGGTRGAVKLGIAGTAIGAAVGARKASKRIKGAKPAA